MRHQQMAFFLDLIVMALDKNVGDFNAVTIKIQGNLSVFFFKRFSCLTLFIGIASACRIVYLENDLLDFHLKFHFIIARIRSKQSENHLEAQQ